MSDKLARVENGLISTGVEPDLEKGETTPATLHPLRFLGMGLLIAWLCCTHIATIYIGGSNEVRLAAETGMRIGDIGTFLAMAAFSRRIGALSRHRRGATALVVLTTLGTGVTGLALAPMGAPTEVVFAASVATAMGGAVLFCLWAEVFCQMGTTSMVVYGGGSCVAAFGAYAVISAMMQPYAVIATALLPVASLACAWGSFRVVAQESPRVAEVSYPIPWKIVLIMAIAGVMSGLTGVLLGEVANLGAVHRIWATAFAGVLLVFMALRRPAAFDMRMMTRVCLFVTVAAFLILPLSTVGLTTVVSFLMKLAYVWFTVFVIAMLANLAYRFDLPSLRLFAIARACSEGGIFVGVAAREALRNSSLALDVPTLLAATLIGLLLVGACVLVWRSERAVNADWGAAGISLQSGIHEPGPRERLIARCDAAAREYGLTERESEMLLLIGQGKTRSQIEQELFLSQNTVKTHIRHLYAKLGVHSKEEACSLLGVE